MCEVQVGRFGILMFGVEEGGKRWVGGGVRNGMCCDKFEEFCGHAGLSGWEAKWLSGVQSERWYHGSVVRCSYCICIQVGSTLEGGLAE